MNTKNRIEILKHYIGKSVFKSIFLPLQAKNKLIIRYGT